MLCESTICYVSMCSIFDSAVYVNGHPAHRHEFAVADGFGDYGELVEWFQSVHGLPFYGVVIKWRRAPMPHNEQIGLDSQ